MKIMLRAAIAALSIASIGSAIAGEGEGTVANTQFTEVPGVVAQADVQMRRRSRPPRMGRQCRPMSPNQAAVRGCSRPTPTRVAIAKPVFPENGNEKGRHLCRPFSFTCRLSRDPRTIL